MFSIIIVNYNTKELIKNCLNSIFLNCNISDFEIIVVDNNSQDSSVEMLKREFGNKIKLIVNNKNRGFGVANNQGVKVAKCKYLFFLNSDTIFTDNILKPINDFFLSNKEVGVVAPKLLLEDGGEQLYAFGPFPKVLDVTLNKFKSIPSYQKHKFFVDWVSGAALVIKKDVFERVNGFDENFFMYFEDIDLCKRVKDLKCGIVVYPEVSVIHLGGKSLSKFIKRKKYYYQSQDYFFRKHYGIFKMICIKIIRWPYKIKNLIINK